MNASRFASQRLRGFSLVELIVVMVIISIIATFVVPAASTIIRGSQITQAAQMITDQISFARQLALTKNKTIEVRFLKFADPETPGEDIRNPDSGRFRAIQLMEVTEAGIAVPTSKLQVIPATVMLNPDSQYSPLLFKTPITPIAATPTSQDPPMPRNVQMNYRYMAFRFLPDGSTDLAVAPSTINPTPTSPTSWFLTMHATTDLNKITGPTDFQKVNFFTLQIDPISGATTSYRPTAR